MGDCLVCRAHDGCVCSRVVCVAQAKGCVSRDADSCISKAEVYVALCSLTGRMVSRCCAGRTCFCERLKKCAKGQGIMFGRTTLLSSTSNLHFARRTRGPGSNAPDLGRRRSVSTLERHVAWHRSDHPSALLNSSFELFSDLHFRHHNTICTFASKGNSCALQTDHSGMLSARIFPRDGMI